MVQIGGHGTIIKCVGVKPVLVKVTAFTDYVSSSENVAQL